jgi:hypothetical protein
MELEEFIKRSIIDIVKGVKGAAKDLESCLYLIDAEGKRTIEFDIAVTAEANENLNGKVGIKVLSLLSGGGEVGSNIKNSKVSRISFGIMKEDR